MSKFGRRGGGKRTNWREYGTRVAGHTGMQGIERRVFGSKQGLHSPRNAPVVSRLPVVVEWVGEEVVGGEMDVKD